MIEVHVHVDLQQPSSITSDAWLLIKSHNTNQEMVTVVFSGGQTVSFLADDLIKAVDNCTNLPRGRG